jgi:hypothetical protein
MERSTYILGNCSSTYIEQRLKNIWPPNLSIEYGQTIAVGHTEVLCNFWSTLSDKKTFGHSAHS